MEYVTFNPNFHDSHKVAELIYDVDFRTFDLLFNSKSSAIERIEKDIKKDECLKVILDNDQLIGILICYTVDKKPKFHFKNYKLFIIDILDYFVLSKVKKGDLYIAELAIDKNQRGKGFGTKVLTDIIEYATKNNYNRVTLDVDLRNTDVKSLYEKVGFKEINKKQLKIANFKRGMFNMEFIICEEAF